MFLTTSFQNSGDMWKYRNIQAIELLPCDLVVGVHRDETLNRGPSVLVSAKRRPIGSSTVLLKDISRIPEDTRNCANMPTSSTE